MSQNRDWSPKFATGLNILSNRHSSKSIRVTNLSFCQNDPPRSTPFWQKNSLVTHIFLIYAYYNIDVDLSNNRSKLK